MQIKVGIRYMKRLIAFFILCFIALSGVFLAAEEPDLIWWEKTGFVPVHQTIRDIPLQGIDTSWRLASELEKPASILTKGSRDIMKEYDLSFSRQGDFNKDGIEDLVTVGVYENKKGERGNFVLVLSKNTKGEWHKVYLAAWPVKPHFMALAEKNGRIEVWYCIDCDNGGELVWDHKTRTYSLHSFWRNNQDAKSKKGEQDGAANRP